MIMTSSLSDSVDVAAAVVVVTSRTLVAAAVVPGLAYIK